MTTTILYVCVTCRGNAPVAPTAATGLTFTAIANITAIPLVTSTNAIRAIERFAGRPRKPDPTGCGFTPVPRAAVIVSRRTQLEPTSTGLDRSRPIDTVSFSSQVRPKVPAEETRTRPSVYRKRRSVHEFLVCTLQDKRREIGNNFGP
jgi:hypothetical protein